MLRLYDYLKDYENSDFYGFHMPGHKQNGELMDCDLPYGMDITEIDGFDDLHHADGILKEAQERAARLFHADETHFLVNGSTVGILSAILGVTERGDKILVARNCHKSAYHAMELGGLIPVYLYPEHDTKTGLNGAASAAEVKQLLTEEPGIKAVVIVSPTYDGVVSDVHAIAEIAHSHGVPLIVDEAHGAHFGFHPYFPENSNVKGADLVIHSVHKTLPSLTQTALLHMNGSLADRKQVRKYLHMLQSSSPSYVLMASIDACMDFLEKEGAKRFASYVEELECLRKALKAFKHLQVEETECYDKSKLVLSVRNADITSLELAKMLREKYHLETEMAAGHYVLCMTSVADTKEGFTRLLAALREIDANVRPCEKEQVVLPLPRARKGENEVAKDYLYLYPPGIPIVVPGEEMTEEVKAYLDLHKRLGFSIVGMEEGEA